MESLKDMYNTVRDIPFVGQLIGVFILLIAVNELIEKYTVEKINPLKLLINLVPRLFQKNKKNSIKNYYNTLETTEYKDWTNQVLKKLYDEYPLAEALGAEFTAVCFKSASRAVYPFRTLCDEEELDTQIDKIELNKPIQLEYKKIVGENIKRPKLKGYMLKKFELNSSGELVKFYAKAGTYEQNIYTSHILEYELYKTFKKGLKGIDQMSAEEILNYMPLRKEIHRHSTQTEILTTGRKRSSLLGVQMLILFWHQEDQEYKILFIKRSKTVAAKPGYYQFIPSGGFEIFENNDNDQILRNNFSIIKALFREFVEEVFGEEEFIHNDKGVPVENITNHDKVQAIIKMIKAETAHMEFLGSVIDLVGLRHELSFLLRIDDPSFSQNIFKQSEESCDTHMSSLKKMKNIIKVDKLNQGSAGLYALASKHPLWIEVTES